MKAGDPVRFRATNGSVGRIESANHYGGFYVRWHYGKDVRGEPMTALSSCRAEHLRHVTEEELLERMNRTDGAKP